MFNNVIDLMEENLLKGKTHKKTSVRDPLAPLPIPTRPQKTTKLQKILQSKYFRIPLLLMLLIFIFGVSLFIAYWTGSRVQKPYSSQPLPIPTPSPTPTPTPEPTANWNTYTNTKYSFLFKYPLSFIPDSELVKEDDIASFLYDSGQTQGGSETTPTLVISVGSTEIDQELLLSCLANIGESGQLETSNNSHIDISIKEVEVDSYRACQSTSISPNSLLINTLFEKDGNIFTIQLVTDRDIESMKTQYSQILSTFQFLDQTDSDTSVFNDARRKTDLEALRSALELYKADHNIYPASLDSLLPEYLATIPKDPATDKPYTYEVSQDKLDYTITTELEDGSLYEVSAP